MLERVAIRSNTKNSVDGSLGSDQMLRDKLPRREDCTLPTASPLRGEYIMPRTLLIFAHPSAHWPSGSPAIQ